MNRAHDDLEARQQARGARRDGHGDAGKPAQTFPTGEAEKLASGHFCGEGVHPEVEDGRLCFARRRGFASGSQGSFEIPHFACSALRS